MVNSPIPKYHKRGDVRSFDAADYVPDMSDMDATNPYALEEGSSKLAQKRVLDKDARDIAIFSQDVPCSIRWGDAFSRRHGLLKGASGADTV